MKFIEEKLIPNVARIGTQPHLQSIRNAFLMTMPLTVAGALAVLINNIGRVFDPSGLDIPSIVQNYDSFIQKTGISNVCTLVNRGTVGTLAILVMLVTAYNLAAEKNGNGIAAACCSLAVYCGLIPRTDGIANVFLDANGLFVGMMLGLIVTEVFVRLASFKKLRINMPEGVPPAVSEAFSNLIPAMLVTFGVIGICAGIESLLNANIWDLVSKFVSTPLSNVADSLGTVIIENLFVTILWMFGIHGASLASSITQPVLYPLLQQNTEAYNNGEPIRNTYVYLFRQVWGQHGGSGATMGFLIAMFLFSSSKAERTIGKVATACGIFQINEPITFGIPIVMNPVYAIPFVFGPALLCTLSYILTQAGIIAPIVLEIPWVTPSLLNAFLATGGSVASVIWSAIEIVILTVLWTPFVVLSNRIELIKALKGDGLDQLS